MEVVSISGNDGDALAMPEAGSLGTTDSLSFGRNGADALADAAMLDMPQPAGLALPGLSGGMDATIGLNFGDCGTDALADASAASGLAGLDDKSEWLSIASLV